ncbi:MAG TPA: BON domain-containing protein [Vicinamibacterales bacterium]|nr:BON domain-containing protein [Vicinamibacterales bacterium]
MGTFALTVLTVGLVQPAAAQVNAVKDAWLVMKVHSEMVNEDLLGGSNIDVDVKNGVVTLQGTVPSEAARARALEVAKKNDGVKNVVDQLKIAPAGDRMGNAGDRADRAADRAGDKADRAMDRAGDKTERAADRTGAAAAAAANKSERAVDNAANKGENAARKTGRAVDDGWIKSKIYAQFMADWNTVLNDSDIDVDVVNNNVTLNGTVKSAEAKSKAVAIAKATDGVKSVKDNLRVAAGTK